MTKITYNAPGHHTLEVEGKSVQGGQSIDVSQETADRLEADPEVDVTVSRMKKKEKED